MKLYDTIYMKSLPMDINSSLFFYKLMGIEKIGGEDYIIFKQWVIYDGGFCYPDGPRYDGAEATKLSDWYRMFFNRNSLISITEEEFLLWTAVQ
tara:strand:- start:2899 stop:3180 length:282 start_codon:yes stop_codon:yes gene_type:complete